jgi:hypothetical protein
MELRRREELVGPQSLNKGIYTTKANGLDLG